MLQVLRCSAALQVPVSLPPAASEGGFGRRHVRSRFIVATTQCGTESVQMTTHLHTTGPEERKSIWLGIGKFLFIVALAVLLFLLAHSMVHHRFFRGGWRNQHGSISP